MWTWLFSPVHPETENLTAVDLEEILSLSQFWSFWQSFEHNLNLVRTQPSTSASKPQISVLSENAISVMWRLFVWMTAYSKCQSAEQWRGQYLLLSINSELKDTVNEALSVFSNACFRLGSILSAAHWREKYNWTRGLNLALKCRSKCQPLLTHKPIIYVFVV